VASGPEDRKETDMQDNQSDASGPRRALSQVKRGAARLAYLLAAAQGHGLYPSTRREALIGEISRRVASLTRLDDLLDETACLLSEAMHCEAAVGLIDEEAGMLCLRYRVAHGRSGSPLEEFNLPLGQGITGWVVTHGRPLLVRDVSQHPSYVEAYPNTRSELAVPLVHQDQVLGVINLDSERLGNFNEDDLRLVSALAGPIAVAISNARLFESERCQRQLAEALLETTRALSSTLSLKSVLQGILEQCAAVLPYATGSILIYEDGLPLLAAVAGYEDIEEIVIEKTKIDLKDSPILSRMASDLQPVIIPDVRQHPGWIELPGGEHIRGWLGMPLVARSELIGVLMLDSDRVGAYAPEHLEIAQALAAHAAIAIENARLFESERRQRQLAEALHEAGAQLAASLDLDVVLGKILEQVYPVVPYDAADLFMVRENVARIVRTRDVSGRDPSARLDISFEVEQTANLRRMFTTHLPDVVPDTQADPDWDRTVGDEWQRSWVGAPIVVQGEAVGFISLVKAETGFYTSQHAAQLAPYADLAAVAVRNASLYQAQARRTAELDALRQVSLGITAELELEALLRSIVERAIKLLDAKAGGMYLYQPERDALVWTVAVGSGLAPTGSELCLGEGLAGKVWLTGQPIIVDDYSHWEGRAAVYEDRPWTAVLGVPIAWGGEFLGVINVLADSGVRTFAPDDAHLLSLFASQAAIAVENARLFTSERHQRQMAGQLRRLASQVGQSLDLDITLNSVLLALLGIVPFDSASIQLVEGGRVRMRAGLGFPEGMDVSGVTFSLDEPLVKEMIEGSGPIIIADCWLDPRFRRMEATDYIRSWIGVPLRHRDELIGVLTLDSRTPNVFTHADAQIAAAYAQHAAIAIGNARLYQAQARRAAELEALREVSLGITAELELDALLRSIVERAITLLDAKSGGVYLYRPEHDALVWAVAVGPSVAQVGSELRLGEGLAGKVWLTGQPIIVDDYGHWEGRAAIYDRYGFTAVLGVPFAWGDEFLGVVDVLADAEVRTFTPDDAHLLSLFASQAAIAIQNAHLYAEAVVGQEQAHDLAMRLMDAQEEERRRIARELHDQVGQALTALKLSLEMGAEQAAPALGDELLDSSRLVDDLINQVRTLSFELRPSSLDDMGLGMALMAHVRDVRQRTGLNIDLHLPDPLPALPPGVETAAYRIVQEALTNVVRHAQASHVSIHLLVAGGNLLLDVSDDGIGFEVGQNWFDRKTGRGFGLLGIQERAERLGGHAHLDSQPDQGTRLQVEIPIARQSTHPRHTPERGKE
jgi:GAF domain-containing protein